MNAHLRRNHDRDYNCVALPATALLSFFVFALALAGFAPAVQAKNPQPDDILKQIGFDAKFDAQVPLDARFQDESGEEVRLGRYFSNKPVLLTLVYFECPMLCTLSLNGLIKSLKPLKFKAGREFDIVTVSFDPKDDPALAAKKKKAYLHALNQPDAERGWHFLTGEESEIQKLTEAVGFRYVYDEKRKEYAHAAGLIVLTPTGKISRYFYDIEYSAKDLQLAVMEASDEKIGSPVDQILLYCFHYDPTTGVYGLAIMRMLRVAGLITVLAILGFIAVMIRREKKKGA